MEERRKHPRFKVRVEARLALGAERFPGRLRDICRDAVLVEVDRTVDIGSEVAVELDLPGTVGPLQAVGRVVRQVEGGDGSWLIAILFGGLTPTAETRIDFFLVHHAREA